MHTIRDKEMYGYDIMKSMKQYFPEVNESTFYAILRRLHADGAAEISIGEKSNGPPRKYYKISESGKEVLRCNIESWKRIQAIVGEIGL